MIVSEEFIKKIKNFGLNSYEAKIWAALLSRGVSTAGELSDIANVPRSRSYDILESLEKKGFIIMKLGKPIKYIAVPPEEVVERVKKNLKKEAEEKINNLEKIRKTELLKELNILHSKNINMIEPSEITGRFKGQNNIHDHLNIMLKGAEESVIIVTTEEGIIRKRNILERNFKKLKKRNVNIRLSTPLTEKNKNIIEKLKEYCEFRNIKNFSARFCIIDNNEILFMLLDNTHPDYDVGIWINTPFFTQAIVELFNFVWKKEELLKEN